MASATTLPVLTTADRLGLALILALALHALIILGVTFSPEDRMKMPDIRPLEIILVHGQGARPEEADYLAQTDQSGGGNVVEKVRPGSPLPSARPLAERGNAMETADAAAPRPTPDRPDSVITTRAASPEKAPLPTPDPNPERPLPTAEHLMALSLEQARLAAEIKRSQDTYAKMPRREWVTANTRKHDSAAYEEAWRDKVERIGNINYPDEARKRRLDGALILDVAIRADGTLAQVKVLRSSGHKALDDGAVRIVQLAAPFAPLPPSMLKRMDVLHIVRTWQFESDSRLQTF